MIPSFAVKPPLSESAARLARPVLLPVAPGIVGGLGRRAGIGRCGNRGYRSGRPAHRAGARGPQGRRRRAAEAGHVRPRRRPGRDLGQRPCALALHRQRIGGRAPRQRPRDPGLPLRRAAARGQRGPPAGRSRHHAVDFRARHRGRQEPLPPQHPDRRHRRARHRFHRPGHGVVDARHRRRRRHRGFGAGRGLQRGRPGGLWRRRQPPAHLRHAQPDGGSAAWRARCPAGPRGQVTGHVQGRRRRADGSHSRRRNRRPQRGPAGGGASRPQRQCGRRPAGHRVRVAARPEQPPEPKRSVGVGALHHQRRRSTTTSACPSSSPA